MHLSQAVGFIMGANIGTTVTAWILSLAGIESSNFFVRLLNPNSFSPILALIGVVFIVFLHDEKKKDIGNILVGFAVLMFGMNTMSGAVKPLAEVPEFTNILLKFSNPVLGVLAGALLTAVIQSSSASVGILQALCVTGAVRYGAALPIIMGQNIGTCITAILSSIGSSTNGKRTAAVHLYFNLLGTIIFMLIFYGLNTVIGFSFMETAVAPAGIAVIHSGFNIFATLIMFPFGSLLEKLARLTVPAKNEIQVDEANQLLDTRFLDTPAVALERCKNVAAKMAELTKDGLITAINLFETYNEDKALLVADLENRVDHYEDALGTYMVKLSSKTLGDRDSQTLSMLLHCIGDLERISDHSVNIMQSASEITKKGLKFSEGAGKELRVYSQAVKDIVELSVHVFLNEDVEDAKKVEPMEELIDDLNAKIKTHHIRRLQSGKCTLELGFILSDVMTDFERVSDHCSNIAVCVSQIHSGGFDTHEYLQYVKSGNDEDFEKEYHMLKEKYKLPS